MKLTAEEFIPTRQSLLSRIKDLDDNASWKVFFDTYWRLIYSTARKSGLNDAESQDVVQETVISVMKSIPDFKYQAKGGSFKRWLIKLTDWRIIDQFRRRSKVQKIEFTEDENYILEDKVSELVESQWEKIWDEEWEANIFRVALERVKAKVEPVHFQIFDLCVVQNWPVLKVSRSLKKNPGNVYLVKHRLGKLMREEVLKLQENPLPT